MTPYVENMPYRPSGWDSTTYTNFLHNEETATAICLFFDQELVSYTKEEGRPLRGDDRAISLDKEGSVTDLFLPEHNADTILLLRCKNLS